ncbi:MAG: O-antigen ligase family protein [Pseudomonadota bacterium]
MTPSQTSQNLPQKRFTTCVFGFALGLLCALMPVGVLAPRIIGHAPAIIGLLMFLLLLFSRSEHKINIRYGLIAATTAAFAALSSLWSFDPEFAMERATKIGLVLLGGTLLFTSFRQTAFRFPQWFFRALPISMLSACAICLFELLTEGFIYYAWRGADPYPGDGNLSMVNRAVVFLTFMLPITLYCVKFADFNSQKTKTLNAVLALIFAAIILLTNSQSAHLAVLVMAIFWFGFRFFARPKIWAILTGLICVGILIMPWAVQFMYQTLAESIKDMPWLADAYAANRLEIWDFVARKALENPLYGFGIEATRHVDHFDTALLYTPHDNVLHPHNAVLQIWIEFGAMGALMLCGFVALVMRSISSLNVQSMRLCTVLFMGLLAVSCTAYGLWQSWWLGLFTLVAAFAGQIDLKIKASNSA